jgi:hypothetical protein
MVPSFDSMPTFRGFFKLHGIDPDDRCGHHRKVEVIDHRLRVSALRLRTADFPFELLEAGSNLPAGSVIFHDLLDGEGKIRGEQSDPLGFAKDPAHSDRALEGLEHKDTIESYDLPAATVEVDTV